jgi:hypothetical protein
MPNVGRKLFFIFGIFITRQPSFRILKEGIHLVDVVFNERIILKVDFKEILCDE